MFIQKLSYSKAFHNTLIYASTANIEEVMKFYNRGDKTFEIDFRKYQAIGFTAKVRSHNAMFSVIASKGNRSGQVCSIFLLTGLRIYTGEYKAQGPTLCPTEGRALRGPRALYSPV